jgi:hypothetical protein
MASLKLKIVTLLYTFVGYMLIAELMRASSRALDTDLIGGTHCRLPFTILLFGVVWAFYNEYSQREFNVQKLTAMRPL